MTLETYTAEQIAAMTEAESIEKHRLDHNAMQGGLYNSLMSIHPQDASDPLPPIIASDYYGVFGDGTDETVQVQEAVDDATERGAVLIWPGRRKDNASLRAVHISSTINVPNTFQAIGGRFHQNADGDFDNAGTPLPMFQWPSGLNTVWWDKPYLVGRTALAMGSKQGMGFDLDFQQPSRISSPNFQHMAVGARIKGQVGAVYSAQFADNDIGLLLNEDSKSLDFFNTAFVGGTEAQVMYSITSDEGTTSIPNGSPKVTFWGSHHEKSDNTPGFCYYKFENAFAVAIKGAYVTCINSPNHTFFKMVDNSHITGVGGASVYEAYYSLEDISFIGPNTGANDIKAVDDEFRSEQVLAHADWGNVFMGKYFRDAKSV